MAPMLSSNSFLLTSAPHPTFIFKNPRFSVFAKKGGDNSSPKDGAGSGNSSPFSFNFGNLPNLPDPKTLVPLPAVPNPSSGLSFGGRRKDPGTVFVAGATGQAGIRIAQTLLRQGFNVRAGVPDLGAAQELAQLAVKYKIISNDESKRLNAVNSTFQEAESIAKAIGNASKVVVTVGPGENGPSAEVTPADALKVLQAAELANVGHVVIVYDRSSSAASTYNVLDGLSSFFNSIFSRSQPLTVVELLQKVVETDISYTLIKTQLTEDFSPESSYNIVLSAEGSASRSSEYKVGNAKIASLVADLFSNTSVAENKVVEVYTNPSASPKTISELFGAIPEDGRRKAYAEALAKAKLEEEAVKATEKAREEAQAPKKRDQNVTSPAQKKAEPAVISTESFLDKAKDITSGFDWAKFTSQLKSAVQKAEEEEEEPKVKVATARGQAKARSLPSLKAVAKTPARQPPPPKPKVAAKTKTKAKQPEPPAEKRKFFGGLFQQDTIYIEDE